MAPPRAPRKSTSATPFTATIRPGAQQPERQTIDETEERHDSGEADSVGDNDEEEAEASQNASDGPLEHLMARMVDGQRKRYDMSKKNIGNAYNDNYENIKESIDAVFDTHEEKASTAHQAQLKRLRDLFNQKVSIETAMRKQLVSLQKIYDAHSRDLETVVDRRLREMK